MKQTTITLNELKQGNKQLCLSPRRALKKCHTCHLYFKCKSKIINEEGERVIKKKEELNQKIRNNQEELQELNKQLDINNQKAI